MPRLTLGFFENSLFGFRTYGGNGGDCCDGTITPIFISINAREIASNATECD